MVKILTLADLPPLPAGATVEILERIHFNDLASVKEEQARELEKVNLFHAIQKVGLFVDVGLLLTIDGKDIPYVVTRINPSKYEIHVTKWYFEEPTGGHRSIELVKAIQEPDIWSKVSEIKGHFGTYKADSQQ